MTEAVKLRAEEEAACMYLGEERKRIGEPSWKPLDRATVEALVGSPVL